MRAVKLTVEPFEFLSYIKLESKKELNHHGVLSITGLIQQEKEQEYMRIAMKETWVNVKAISETEEEVCFFVGILSGMWIKKENQMSILTIEIKTGSFLLDIQPHIRSFQDINFSYSDIIYTCVKAAGGDAIIREKEKEKVKQFLLQYNETDWEFMKRLASYMGVSIISEDATPGKKLYFGHQKKNLIDVFNPESYQIVQDYKKYEKKVILKVEGLILSDMVSYIAQTREIYNLGEFVSFKGQNLIVGKITSWLKGQELYHEYHLITEKNTLLPAVYNLKLSGVSLKAQVTAVNKTMVQVQIEEDENKENCKNCWFDYATVYSTPDGTGWYCMPEVGDKVRVVFPDSDESNAYVSSSVHVGATGGRINPDEKSWKNKQGKEILFTSTSISMKNNQGLLIELSDQEGINIKSNKDITIQSDGNIQIKSQDAGVHIFAENNISMQQGAAKIQIDDAINIYGGKIYMN